MAGNKIKLKTQLRASSLIEVVIAMVLIMLVFGIAMTIFTNVTRTSLPIQKIRATAILQEQLLKTEAMSDQSPHSLTIDGFRIEQTVETYPADMHLKKLVLVAYDLQQQKLAQVEKIILFNHE